MREEGQLGVKPEINHKLWWDWPLFVLLSLSLKWYLQRFLVLRRILGTVALWGSVCQADWEECLQGFQHPWYSFSDLFNFLKITKEDILMDWNAYFVCRSPEFDLPQHVVPQALLQFMDCWEQSQSTESRVVPESFELTTPSSTLFLVSSLQKEQYVQPKYPRRHQQGAEQNEG